MALLHSCFAALHPVRAGLLAIVILPGAAGAHSAGSASSVGWHDWSFEPWASFLLAVFLAWYVIGALRLWRRSGPGSAIRRREILCWISGWIVAALSLLSPIDALGAELFWMHMVQHELLMLVAAPLMILGRPLPSLLWALPAPARQAMGGLGHSRAWRLPWRLASSPLGAWWLHALAIWGWHLPVIFQRALENEGMHILQHLSFMLTALLFWWSVLRPGSRPALLSALMSVFTTAVHTSALGALLVFATTVFYPAYASSAPAWGWSALEDQQLGGLVMWVPGGMAYLVAALLLMGRVLHTSAGRARFTRASHSG